MSIEAMLMAAGSKNFIKAGDPFGGGLFVRYMLDEVGVKYALVVSLKAEGSMSGGIDDWGNAQEYVQYSVNAGGKSDWKLPDVDESFALYREFKPTTDSNVASFGSTNRTVPPLGDFTSGDPSQTSLIEFQEGGSESFVVGSYWTDTSQSSSYKHTVNFMNGNEYVTYSNSNYYIRAVRRDYS